MKDVEFYKNETSKALASFNLAIEYSKKYYPDPVLKVLLRNSTIQSFEYCTEIFWKFLKRYLTEFLKINIDCYKNLKNMILFEKCLIISTSCTAGILFLMKKLKNTKDIKKIIEIS